MAVENVSIRLSADAKKIDAVLDRIDARLKKISSKSISLTTKGSTKAIDEVASKMSKLKSKGVDVTVSAKGFDKVEQAQRRLATAQARLQDQLGKGASSTTTSSTVTQIGALQNRLNALKAADISAPFNKVNSVIDSLSGRMDGLANKVLKIGAGFAATGVALGVALGKSALGDAADLEATMGQLQAMLGATDKDMAGLDKRAVDLGNDLKLPGVSAGDAAMAMKEMAANGLSLKDSMDGARSVLELAKVANLDYAESARIVATQLNTFGLSGDKASEVSNKLAKVSGASGVKIDEMAIAASQAGLVAKSSGMSFNQMADALGLLARNGLRGSDAGTSLKTALIRLSAPTADVAKEMKRYGLEFRDANGNMKDFRGISEELQGKLKGLSKAQQDAAMASIFGTDAIRVGNIMMEQGSAGYDEFTKRVQGAGDASAQLAGKTKGLQGVIEAIKSTWDTGMLTIGKSLSPVFTEIAKKISDFASKVDFKAVGDKMAGFVRSIMTEVSKIDWKVVMDKVVSAFKSFIEMAKILGAVTKTVAKIIGGGDMAVGLGRISAAAILAGPALKILSPALKGVGLALKGIQFAKLTKELGGLANVAAAGGKFSGLASTLTSVGGAVSKIPGGGGLISLLANPYVLGGAAVLGGIALAAKAIDSALNFKNNATLTTENFNSALANLRAEGLQPSATAVQDLKDKFDQYAKSGIVPTVEDITQKFKEQEVQVRAVRDRFIELKNEGVPSQEALTKAIEEQNAKLREQNQIKAAQKDFAQKELENQIKNQKVVTNQGVLGVGKKEITIDKLLQEQLDKFRKAAKLNPVVIAARVDMQAPEGVNKDNVNKLIHDLMVGDKGEVTVDALGRVNVKLKDGVQVDQKELETAKNAMQAEIDDRLGQFPANVSLTVDGQKFEGNIVEVRRQIEEKLGQSPSLKEDILTNLNITPNIEAGDLSGQVAGLVASIKDKVELGNTLNEKIFSTIAFTPAQIGALQQNGIEAGTIFSAAIASSAFKGLQTTEDKVQFLNNTLKQLSGDVNFAVNLENPQETIDKLIQLGVIKDDATKAAIIEVFANSGIAEDKLAVVKEKVNAIPTDKTVKVNAVDNASSVISRIAKNLSGLASAALNVIGRSSGGVVPSYRSAGGIIDKPKYYSKGTSFVDWKPRGTDNVPAMLTRKEGVLKVPSMGIIGRGAFAKLNSGNRGGVLAGAKELVNRLGGSAGQVITNNTSESNSPVTNNSITQEFNFNSSNNSGNLNSMWRARSILGSVI